MKWSRLVIRDILKILSQVLKLYLKPRKAFVFVFEARIPSRARKILQFEEVASLMPAGPRRIRPRREMGRVRGFVPMVGVTTWPV